MDGRRLERSSSPHNVSKGMEEDYGQSAATLCYNNGGHMNLQWKLIGVVIREDSLDLL